MDQCPWPRRSPLLIDPHVDDAEGEKLFNEGVRNFKHVQRIATHNDSPWSARPPRATTPSFLVRVQATRMLASLNICPISEVPRRFM